MYLLHVSSLTLASSTPLGTSMAVTV
ncbi:MAG: hypothetical protein MGAcid_15620, partial [uncultured Acidilobus sp. MG]